MSLYRKITVTMYRMPEFRRLSTSAKLEEFFSELQPIELWGGNFLIPLRIESYLEFCYGSDWRVPKFAPWSNSCWQPPADRDRHAREFQPKTAR